jgi:amidase
MGESTALHALNAEQAVALLRRREVSPVEMVEAAARRMEAVEPRLNAMPTRCIERALERARNFPTGAEVRPGARGWLAGLPVAVKDLNPVQGVRTTYGSLIYAEHEAPRSDVLVELLEASGALVVGKSNTPEFGAGASTFNEVFGRTRNPWNTARSVAGSSGGSAAALAAGEVWLAHGSDLGGSLRTPASFNGIVGLRPAPGRVPRGLFRVPFDTAPSDLLMVEGPMGRTARDVALMLDAMTGEHPEDPLSLPRPAAGFLAQLEAASLPRRVAFSPDLGVVPVDPQVVRICEAAARRFEDLGVVVEEATPDLNGAVESFQVLRAALFAADHVGHLRAHRDRLKPDVVWNIEKGLALTGEQIADADAVRLRIMGEMMAFLSRYDLLLCPAAIVTPFDVEVRYVEEVAGHHFDNYVHWLAITFAITLSGCPAASVPAGLSADGMPVGLQIVGPHRGEAAVLAAAHRLDELTGLSRELPRDPATAA